MPSETIVCRCEEVTLEQLQETVKSYQCSSRELKLRTRAGMGHCAGRTCRTLIDTIVKEASGTAIPHSISLGYQPPVRPISFGDLGGNK